jgi:hypothetical protein
MKKGAARSILLAIIANDIGRLFTLPPAVPAVQVAVMRKAFDVTFTDSEFRPTSRKPEPCCLGSLSSASRKLPCRGWDIPAADKGSCKRF